MECHETVVQVYKFSLATAHSFGAIHFQSDLITQSDVAKEISFGLPQRVPRLLDDPARFLFPLRIFRYNGVLYLNLKLTHSCASDRAVILPRQKRVLCVCTEA